jgi:tetratricopeptide (TPR) repeat protein
MSIFVKNHKKYTNLTMFSTNRNFRIIAFIMLMSTATVFTNATLIHPPTKYQKHKAEVAERIYHEIARTVKDSRKAPTFNFIFSEGEPYYNAYYNPQNNTINFGEGIYDLAVTFGKDSLNALAMVLGHELAHFYKDHGWGMSFGTANEDTEIAKKIYDMELNENLRAKMEAEADYFGGLFGYMAGYNTLEVGADFYNKLYETVGLPDSTAGYPTRNDRVEICRNSKKMLKDLVPVFKAANLLTLIQQYEKAALCYDHIANVFPSREIYNNAGVAYLALAMDTYEEEEMPYIYPMGIDFETRMETTAKGMLDDQPINDKRVKALALAKQQFEDAIRIDEDYAPAYINLSMTLALQGDTEMALANGSKGARLAKEQGKAMLEANGYLVRGIIYALKGKKAEARKEWKLARLGNTIIAELNLKALNESKLARLFRKKPKPETAGLEETIADLGIEVMEVLFEDKDQLKVSVIERQNEDRPETIVVGVNEEEFDAILLASYGGYMGLDEELQGFLMTKANYEGETARGIKIGSSLKELKEAYGDPARTYAGLNANYHFYQLSNLIVITNNANIVTGWMLFGKIQ